MLYVLITTIKIINEILFYIYILDISNPMLSNTIEKEIKGIIREA